jgi:putative Mg2+ transporter-C (MgtC) family protein
MTEFLDTELWAKLLLALACGAAIGMERQIREKPAGARTNMLICVGSTLITMVSIHVALSYAERGINLADPGRIAAQIVSGVGFIGAGTIIQARGAVHGLTTAATIWVMAGIGLAIGSGFYAPAVATTILILLILWALRWLGRNVVRPRKFVLFRVSASRETGVLAAIQDAVAETELDFGGVRLERAGARMVVEFGAPCTPAARDRLLERLLAIDTVEDIQAQA